MSKKMAATIMAYGVIVLALSLVFRTVAPGKTAFFYTALTAGFLSLACGAAVWMGHQRRVWIVLVTSLFTFFTITHVVGEWTSPPADRLATTRALSSFMLLLTFGVLAYSLHGERPPEFYEPQSGKRR